MINKYQNFLGKLFTGGGFPKKVVSKSFFLNDLLQLMEDTEVMSVKQSSERQKGRSRNIGYSQTLIAASCKHCGNTFRIA